LTRWSPDTCSCVIDYTDDGNFTLVSIVSKGTEHSGLDDATTYSIVKAENQRKNAVPLLVTALVPTVTNTVWLNQVTWSFSGSGQTRVLTVNLGALLTAPQKTTLQTTCDTQLGVGAVVIQ
jgi:hypothetical protein